MFEPGKWKCPRCQGKNYKRNTSCFSCGWSKDESSSGGEDEVNALRWTCNVCGHANNAKESHCLKCTCPSDETVEQIRQERYEQRYEQRERKAKECRRSSVSAERVKRKAEEEEKRLRFQEAMSQDTKSMPCIPQRLGEARSSMLKGIEGYPPPRFPQRSDASVSLRNTDDKKEWDSDNEAYDEFGRLKRCKRAKDEAPGGGQKARASALSARQQAALERLQSKGRKR